MLKLEIEELKQLYKESLEKVDALIESGKIIAPPRNCILNSLDGLSFNDIKVILLGQDPYPGEGHANGLSFSVNPGVEIPASLQNIFKELKSDLGYDIPTHGDLSNWKNQGVLLLNRVLTTEVGKKKEHARKMGWENFTEKLVRVINDNFDNKVFILWGSDAKFLKPYLNEEKHLILSAAHPSPLSASKGFFGCKHFSKTNKYLQEKGIKPIDWSL